MSEEDKFDCPLCGFVASESEVLTHLDTCSGTKTTKPEGTKSSKYYKALHDYAPSDKIELKLVTGDIVTFISKHDDEWMKGELDGEIGLFKISLCEPTDQPPTPKVDDFIRMTYNPRKNPRPSLLKSTSMTSLSSPPGLRRQTSQKLLDLGLVRAEKGLDSYLMGRNDEVQFIAKMKGSFQSKKDTIKKDANLGTLRGKQKDIIFVVGNTRFYAFKDSGKVKHDIHIVDIQELSSPATGALTIRFQNSSLTLFADKLGEVCDALHICWLANFPTRKFPFMVETVNLREKKEEIGPCGGYKQSYVSLCDCFGVPVSADVCFTIETIYGPSSIKEFNISEFDFPKTSTGKEAIEPLRFNPWFEVLKVPLNSSSPKLAPEIISVVADVLRQNSTIRVLEMTNVPSGAPWTTIGKDLVQNKSLLTVNFSHSEMEDRGLIGISTDFFAHCQNLTHIDISSCSAEKKGMVSFFKALQSNQLLIENLRKLIISNNRLDGDGSIELGIFLSKAKTLLHLEMANTSPNYTNILGKATNKKTITHLDISHNKISKKEASLIGRLLGTMPLAELKVVGTKIDGTKIEHLISILNQTKGLRLLDLSDNDIGDEGFLQFRDFLVGPNSEGLASLNALYLNRCISVKGKYTNRLVDGLTDLASQPNRCPIEVLHVAGDTNDSKFQLKGLIIDFILNLLVNESLVELNISGHKAGDTLAITLSKVVQANKKLEKLLWDDNDITSIGFKKFKVGLERNVTLGFVSYPLYDLNLKKDGQVDQDIDKILSKIQTHVVSATE